MGRYFYWMNIRLEPIETCPIEKVVEMYDEHGALGRLRLFHFDEGLVLLTPNYQKKVIARPTHWTPDLTGRSFAWAF